MASVNPPFSTFNALQIDIMMATLKAAEEVTYPRIMGLCEESKRLECNARKLESKPFGEEANAGLGHHFTSSRYCNKNNEDSFGVM